MKARGMNKSITTKNLRLTKSTKILTTANSTKIQTLGTIQLNLTPERISNKRQSKTNI